MGAGGVGGLGGMGPSFIQGEYQFFQASFTGQHPSTIINDGNRNQSQP